MRGNTKYLLAIMAACILMAFMNKASAMGEDISDLKKLISVNEDIRMNSQDLAFFLATHNYSAVPKDGYVNVIWKARSVDSFPMAISRDYAIQHSNVEFS